MFFLLHWREILKHVLSSSLKGNSGSAHPGSFWSSVLTGRVGWTGGGRGPRRQDHLRGRGNGDDDDDDDDDDEGDDDGDGDEDNDEEVDDDNDDDDDEDDEDDDDDDDDDDDGADDDDDDDGNDDENVTSQGHCHLGGSSLSSCCGKPEAPVEGASALSPASDYANPLTSSSWWHDIYNIG